MFVDNMQVGDEIVVKMNDYRGHGFGPGYPKDGTVGVVIGFEPMIRYAHRIETFGREPGVYVGRGRVHARFEDGRELPFLDHMVVFRNDSLHATRAQERRDAGLRLTDYGTKIRDLPETPFVEWDIVRLRESSQIGTREHRHDDNPWKHTLRVRSVDYESLDVNGGGRVYAVEPALGNGAYMYVSAADLELIEHGNIWKAMHGEPLEFASLREQAKFEKSLGRTCDVRSADGTFKWLPDTAFGAIQSGTADCTHDLKADLGRFGSSLIRFEDRTVGERVRRAFLRGAL